MVTVVWFSGECLLLRKLYLNGWNGSSNGGVDEHLIFKGFNSNDYFSIIVIWELVILLDLFALERNAVQYLHRGFL